MMEYINQVSNLTPDDANAVKTSFTSASTKISLPVIAVCNPC